MIAPASLLQSPDPQVDRAATSATAQALPSIGDYYRWGHEQAALLRQGRFDLVDVANIADEIESVAKSELRSMRSNIEIILVHLLKWDFQPGKRTRSWINTIDEHRECVALDLGDSPSLASLWDETVAKAYRPARSRAAREAKLDVRDLPAHCPFDRERIMSAPHALDRR